MTSNLLISAFDVPLNSLIVEPGPNKAFDEDSNQYNLQSKNRYSLCQFTAATAHSCTRYDLGSSSTKSVDHFIIARADILKTAGVSQVVLRGSSSFRRPDDISGLTAWYDANQGITKDGSDLVSQWDDLSGNGYHMTQGTGSKQPLWKAPSAGINDNCAVLFDNTDDILNNVALGTLFSGTDLPISVFAVVKRTGTADGDAYFSIGNTTGGNLGCYYFAGYVGGGAGWRITKIDDAVTTDADAGGTPETTTRVMSMVHTGTTASIWADGSNLVNGATNNVGTVTTNNASIGGLIEGGGAAVIPFGGYICEIIVFNTAVGTTDRQAIEAYLTAKWEAAAVYKDTSFASATLYGPRSNDYVGTLTASTAYRWWSVEYYGTSQKFCRSKESFGSWFDIGHDVSTYEIDRIPAKEARWYADSGMEYQNRISEEIYRITMTWKHVTIANATAFMNQIARYAHRASFFLYTTAEHKLLDNQRVLHVRIVPGSIRREDALYNYQNITVQFEEVIG